MTWRVLSISPYPVPCSALRDPWYFSATISHISCIIAAYRFTSWLQGHCE
jgi:hypothetical protein